MKSSSGGPSSASSGLCEAGQGTGHMRQCGTWCTTNPHQTIENRATVTTWQLTKSMACCIACAQGCSAALHTPPCRSQDVTCLSTLHTSVCLALNSPRWRPPPPLTPPHPPPTCSSPMRDRSHTITRRSAPHEASTVSLRGDHPICTGTRSVDTVLVVLYANAQRSLH
jgi:hypothetical protein